MESEREWFREGRVGLRVRESGLGKGDKGWELGEVL